MVCVPDASPCALGGGGSPGRVWAVSSSLPSGQRRGAGESGDGGEGVMV